MKFNRYLQRILRQKSTWKGLFVLLNSMGVYLAPDQQELFLSLLGLLGVHEVTRDEFPEDRRP